MGVGVGRRRAFGVGVGTSPGGGHGGGTAGRGERGPGYGGDLSPSVVSHSRCRSTPVTSTLVPVVRDSATLSAAWCQIEQGRNVVPSSIHWPVSGS